MSLIHSCEWTNEGPPKDRSAPRRSHRWAFSGAVLGYSVDHTNIWGYLFTCGTPDGWVEYIWFAHCSWECKRRWVENIICLWKKYSLKISREWWVHCVSVVPRRTSQWLRSILWSLGGKVASLSLSSRCGRSPQPQPISQQQSKKKGLQRTKKAGPWRPRCVLCLHVVIEIIYIVLRGENETMGKRNLLKWISSVVKKKKQGRTLSHFSYGLTCGGEQRKTFTDSCGKTIALTWF